MTSPRGGGDFVIAVKDNQPSLCEAVRGHWGIEAAHRVLGVTFREDDSRTRERTPGNDLRRLRRFAVPPEGAPCPG